MPFEKGRKKTGGRTTGISVNKLRREVIEKLAEISCDPILGMAKLAQDPESSPELRGKMHAELAKYLHRQKHSVELGGPDGNTLKVEVTHIQPNSRNTQ